MEPEQISQENQSEAPNLWIRSRSSPSLDLELARLSVIAIAVDTAEQELYFVRLEETPSRLLRDLFREIDYEDVAKKTDADGQDAFEYEDPSPAVIACCTSLMDLG